MPAGAESLLLGIELSFDASGMVSGARIADQNFDRIKDKARATSETVSGEMDAMAAAGKKAFALIGAGTVLAFGGKTVLSFLGSGVEEAKALGDGMFNVARVADLLGTEGAAQLEGFRNQLLDIGIKTPFSPQEAAEGLESLISVGLEANAAMGVLESTLQLVQSTGGRISIRDAAGATGVMMAKFQLSAEDATEALDQFVTTGNKMALDPSEIRVFMNSIASAPFDLGMTTSEVFALGGALRNFGQLPAQAGASISGLSRKLLILNKNMVLGAKGPTMDMFKKLNVQIFDANGKFRGMNVLLPEIVENVAKLGTEQERATTLSSVFGTQAKNVLGAVAAMSVQTENGVLKGAEAFRFLTEEIEATSSGTLQRTADAFATTSKGIEDMWKGTFDTVMLIIGESLLPILDDVMTVGATLGNMFIEFAKRNKKLVQVITQIVAVLAAATMVVGVLLALIGGGILLWAGFTAGLTLLGLTLGTVATAVAILSAALIALTVLASLGAFDPMIASMNEAMTIMGLMWSVISGEGISLDDKALLKQSGLMGFTEWLASTWDVVQSFFIGMGKGFADFSVFGGDVTGLIDILGFLWDQLKTGIDQALTPVLKELGLVGFASKNSAGMMEMVGIAIGAVIRFLLDMMIILGPVMRLVGAFVGGMIAWFISLWNNIKNVFIGIANILGGFIGIIVGLFNDDVSISAAWEQMWDGIKTATSGILGTLFDVMTGIFARAGAEVVLSFFGGFDKVWSSLKDTLPSFMFGSDAKEQMDALAGAGPGLVPTAPAALATNTAMPFGPMMESGLPFTPGQADEFMTMPAQPAASALAGMLTPPVAGTPSVNAPGQPTSNVSSSTGGTTNNRSVALQFGNVSIQTMGTGQGEAPFMAEEMFRLIKEKMEKEKEDGFSG